MSKLLWERVSRATGTRYEIREVNADAFTIRCEHGTVITTRSKSAAVSYVNRLAEICDACADGVDDVRPQRLARIEWTDDRHMMRQLVDAATGDVIATGILSGTNLHSIVRAEWLRFDDVPIVEPDEPDLDWNARAACKGMPARAFFEDAWQPGPKHRSKGYEAARAVCLTCPVRAECRDDALTMPSQLRQGVRGGYDPEELSAASEESADSVD